MHTPADRSRRKSHRYFQQTLPYQLEMVRPAIAGMAHVPPLLEEYLVRQFRQGDERQYDELFHLAFEDEGRFPEILGRTLPGGFFVVEHMATHRLVSSCLAFHGSSSPRHPGAGQLGWLVTDPEHTQKQLGTLVSALATNRLLEEGYSRPFLGTEDERLTAIAIYLKLDWQPYLYRDDMEPRWRAIFAALGRDFDAVPK